MKKRKEEEKICPVANVQCHVSRVTCWESHVMCQTIKPRKLKLQYRFRSNGDVK